VNVKQSHEKCISGRGSHRHGALKEPETVMQIEPSILQIGL